MRVTTKRKEAESGLRRLWNSERGYDIKVDGQRIGSIGFARGYGDRSGNGWYYSIHTNTFGVPGVNTSGVLVADREALRASAVAYVKAALRKAKPSEGEAPR